MVCALYRIANKPDRFFGLVDTRSAGQYLAIKEYLGIFKNQMLSEYLFMSITFNTTTKVTTISLALIKKMMGLLTSIQHRCLAWINNPADKRSFSSITSGQKRFTLDPVD